jgi:hypothetical protein
MQEAVDHTPWLVVHASLVFEPNLPEDVELAPKWAYD